LKFTANAFGQAPHHVGALKNEPGLHQLQAGSLENLESEQRTRENLSFRRQIREAEQVSQLIKPQREPRDCYVKLSPRARKGTVKLLKAVDPSIKFRICFAKLHNLFIFLGEIW